MSSLRHRLLGLLLLGAVLVSLTAAGATWYWAQREMSEVLDYQLRQQALSLADKAYLLGSVAVVEPDPEQHIVTQLWDRRGNLRYQSHQGVVLDRPERYGYASVRGVARLAYSASPGRTTFPCSLRPRSAHIRCSVAEPAGGGAQAAARPAAAVAPAAARSSRRVSGRTPALCIDALPFRYGTRGSQVSDARISTDRHSEQAEIGCEEFVCDEGERHLG